jgi:hypothetical protein
MNPHRLSILLLSFIIYSSVAQEAPEKNGWKKFKSIFIRKIKKDNLEILESQDTNVGFFADQVIESDNENKVMQESALQEDLEAVEKIKFDDENINQECELEGELSSKKQDVVDQERFSEKKEVVASDKFAEELAPSKDVITNVQVEQSNNYQQIQEIVAQLERMRLEQEQKEISFFEWLKRKRGLIIATTCAIVGGVAIYHDKHYALFNWFKGQVGCLDDFLNPERKVEKYFSEKELALSNNHLTCREQDRYSEIVYLRGQLEDSKKELFKYNELSRQILLDEHTKAAEINDLWAQELKESREK